MKKVLIATISIVLLLTMSVSAYARWAGLRTCEAGLSFSGSTANCTATASASDSTITATMTLQKRNIFGGYSTLATWENLTAENYLRESRGYSSVSSGTYRVLLEVTAVTSGGQTDYKEVETIVEK